MILSSTRVSFSTPESDVFTKARLLFIKLFNLSILLLGLELAWDPCISLLFCLNSSFFSKKAADLGLFVSVRSVSFWLLCFTLSGEYSKTNNRLLVDLSLPNRFYRWLALSFGYVANIPDIIANKKSQPNNQKGILPSKTAKTIFLTFFFWNFYNLGLKFLLSESSKHILSIGQHKW